MRPSSDEVVVKYILIVKYIVISDEMMESPRYKLQNTYSQALIEVAKMEDGMEVVKNKIDY